MYVKSHDFGREKTRYAFANDSKFELISRCFRRNGVENSEHDNLIR